MNTSDLKTFLPAAFAAARFPTPQNPCIVVLRNACVVDYNYLTPSNGEMVLTPDSGRNICDSIVLVDGDGYTVLAGRSYPEIDYINQGLNTNHIASSFLPKAYVHGLHQGKYKALIQGREFLIWRTSQGQATNAETKSETEAQTGFRAYDNFHGFAPQSQGCVTVVGVMFDMYPSNSHHWAIAYDWLYGKHANDGYFDLAILQAEDVFNPGPSLRIGSEGEDVKRLQEILQLETDGWYFGDTFAAVRAKQRDLGMVDDGIVRQALASKLGLEL